MDSVKRKRKIDENSNEILRLTTGKLHNALKRRKRAFDITKNKKSSLRRGNIKRGLPRPKTPLSFSFPHQDARSIALATLSRSGSQSPATPDGAKSSINHLKDVLHIINLIIRRNKNQHRAQPFWKYLSLLYRSLKKLLSLHEQILSIIVAQPSSAGGRLSAEDVRKRFETEIRLRGEKEFLEEHVRENLVPKCYVRFSVVVGDTQFANLGLVLMGILADVAGVVGLMKRHASEHNSMPKSQTASAKQRDPRDSPVSILGTSTRVTGEDHGEVVQRIYGASNPTSSNEGAESDGNNLGMLVQHGDASSLERQPALEELTKPESPSSSPREYISVRRTNVTAEGSATSELSKKNIRLPSGSGPSEFPKRKTKSKERSKKKGGAFDDLFKGLM